MQLTQFILSLVEFAVASPANPNVEVPSRRSCFYVGGHYENITQPALGPGNVHVEQCYVERLRPLEVVQKYPLVFIPGGFQTGTLNTPDDRKGWASYFLEKGFERYLVDPPERGRCPWIPAHGVPELPPTSFIEQFFTATAKFNLWPQARLHNQWSGSGLAEDLVFNAFFRSQVQTQMNWTMTELSTLIAGIDLLGHIGPAILVTHSRSGTHGWVIGDARPELVQGIVALEPAGPPFKEELPFSGPARPWGVTTLPVVYEPEVINVTTDLRLETVPSDPSSDRFDCIQQVEPARKFTHLSQIPVVVVTSEASYHATYDHCTVGYLRQAGVNVEWFNLPEYGIHGNGYIMFMEKNNQDIARLINEWVQQAAKKVRSGLSKVPGLVDQSRGDREL